MIAFLMNGCLVDRIKQRMYAKEVMKKQQLKEVKTFQKPKLYTPSPSPLTATQQPAKKVVKKSNKSIKHKKSSAKKTTTHTHKKRVKKAVIEPYSIEKDESDPELLGPQTTLKSNPLTKKESSSTTNKM
jgi:hypothetical protein